MPAVMAVMVGLGELVTAAVMAAGQADTHLHHIMGIVPAERELVDIVVLAVMAVRIQIVLRLTAVRLDQEVQAAVAERWDSINDETLYELTDYAGFRKDFEQLFGFEVDGVDYSAPTEVNRALELVEILD